MNAKMKGFRVAVSAIVIVALVTCATHSPAQSDAAKLNTEAVDLFEAGRTLEALEKLRVAAAQAPSDPLILSNLGYVYQSLGRYGEAEDVIKRAISIEPMNLDAHNILGICNYYLGNIEKAVAEWEWILRVDPADQTAGANLALASGKAAPADTALKPLPAPITPSSSLSTLEEMFYAAKKAYKAGDYNRTVTLLTDVLEVKPGSLISHYYIGLALGWLGHRSEAVQHLREYLILESYPPGSAAAYSHARAAFDSLSRKGTMPSGAASASGDAGRSFAEGKRAYKGKDYFRAIHYLKAAIEKKPDSFQSNFYLGLSYGAVGDRERAVFHLSKCLVLLDPAAKDFGKTKASIQKAIETVIRKY